MLSASSLTPHIAHCRFVDSEVRKEWATLGKAYTDLKDKLDDHMARQRLNAAIALRFPCVNVYINGIVALRQLVR